MSASLDGASIKLVTPRLPWLGAAAAAAFQDLEMVANDGQTARVNKSVLASISPVLRNILKRFDASHELVLHLDMSGDRVKTILDLAVHGSVTCATLDVQLREDMTYLGIPLDQLRVSCGDQTISMDAHLLPGEPSRGEVLKQLPTEIKEEQSLSELVIDFREEDEEETSDFGAEGGFLNELAHSRSQSVGEMIACSYCGQEFAGHKRLNTHVRQHHTSVCCVTCGETFGGERNLKRHQKSAHGRDGVPVLACELCGKRCRSLSDLQTHLEEHKGEQFACPQCAKLFRTQRRLTKHIQGVHEGGYRNPASEADYAYACDVCGRKFHLKTNFNRHKLKHTEERSQMCSICGSTFKSLPDLKRHVEGVHDKSRKKVYQYKCDVCNKHFYMKSHLTEHMYSHSTEKTFKCSLCDLALKSPQNLNRHLRKVHDNADKNKKSRIKRSQWPNKG